MVLRRGVDAATLEAMAAGPFFPVVLVFVDWPDAPVHAHSGVGVIEWDGAQWHGVGPYGAVEIPDEGGGLASRPANLRMVGLDDRLDDYLDAPVRNRRARILCGVVTERGGTELIGEPFELFSGYVDAMRDLVEGADGELRRGVALQVASGPSQRSSAEIYHTPEDQALFASWDTAGRLVLNAEAEAQRMTWPE